MGEGESFRYRINIENGEPENGLFLPREPTRFDDGKWKISLFREKFKCPFGFSSYIEIAFILEEITGMVYRELKYDFDGQALKDTIYIRTLC